jgi:hypothetical protein
MVIEDHRHARRKRKAEKLAEMDKELYELKADIKKLNYGCGRIRGRDGCVNGP